MTIDRSIPCLASDVDDTIVPLFGPFIEWHNKIYGTNASIEIVRDFSTLYDVFGITQEELIKRVHVYMREEGLDVAPITGAVEALDKLRKVFPRQALVSGRQHAIRGVSFQYFEKFMPKREFETVFCNHFVGNDVMTKSQACCKVGALYIVEDSLEYAVECAENGIFVFLFGNYPWNDKPIPDHVKNMIKRAPDWNTVVEHFEL